uniref:Si:zfos-1056e6.1 n=1 Tax=Haplochromis burtoni TaxID=8153 RepID=A0A3Q2W0J1_HAPBU
IRNHHGHLIPLNSSIPANSKHPYVLEVAKIFQHCPKPRTIPMTVINKTMKTRLQTIERRIQRLEDLLPQVKLRRNEKLTQQEIECLNQKLRFLHQRMQANSHTWKGVLIRAPLW